MPSIRKKAKSLFYIGLAIPALLVPIHGKVNCVNMAIMRYIGREYL